MSCTLWPDNDRNRICCDRHDQAYREGMPRREADREFLKCLLEHGHPVTTSVVMWLGVRLFGWPFYLWHRVKRHGR